MPTFTIEPFLQVLSALISTHLNNGNIFEPFLLLIGRYKQQKGFQWNHFFVNSGTRGRVWIRFFWVYLAGEGEPKSEPAGEAA